MLSCFFCEVPSSSIVNRTHAFLFLLCLEYRFESRIAFFPKICQLRCRHSKLTSSRMALLDDTEEGCRAYGKVSLGTRLKAILLSQASFGSTIGGPILFFVGGFICMCPSPTPFRLCSNDTS